MKKIVIYFASLIVGLSLFISCEDLNEPVILKDSDKFVAFNTSAVSVKENNGEKIGILVYIASTGGAGCSVDFYFDTQGIALPAVEGVNFNVLNDTRTLTFTDSYGFDTIWIEPIDNLTYDKNKSIYITLSWPNNGYSLGRESSALLTVVDNEHPLSLVIGDYTIDYLTGYSSGGSDGSVSITTYPNPEDETQVYFLVGDMFPGYSFIDTEIILANVDLVAGTFKIAAGQAAPTHGYGPSKFTGYDAVTLEQFEDGEYITGTIDASGNITMPHYTGMQITSGSNEGKWFNLWKSSVWNKNGKGASNDNSVVVNQPRFK
ncbi:MAG: hypothetical protein RBT49_04460 [Bacteroidales bacterium]|nr:hypothetical protein [Bacteroidales bacterium]